MHEMHTLTEHSGDPCEQKIREAAETIFSSKKGRGAYKQVCMEMGLNLNKNGVYLGAKGDEYKLIQTAIRKIRRRLTNEILSTERQARQAAEQRAQTAEKQRDEMSKRLKQMKQRAETAEKQRDKLSKRLKQMETAQQFPIPLGSPILIVLDEWIDMYCKRVKQLEIRSRSCNKPRGSKIYLSGNTSGGVGLILATVVFEGSRKISSEEDWEFLRPLHRNPHEHRRYGDRTHAWIFRNIEILENPIPFHVPKGTRDWCRYSPPQDWCKYSPPQNNVFPIVF